MKAAIVEMPGTLVVKDVPIPKVSEYGVLCRMLFGATCTSTDQHLIDDKMPWKVAYPIVLGHESIGRVVEVGAKVRHLRVGDLVTRVGMPEMPEIGLNVSWGGFCEFGIAIDHRAMCEDGCPRETWKNYRINQKLPLSADPAASTMVITWRETLSYVRRLGVKPGCRVLVLGSGGTALAFIAHCRNIGASMIGSTGNRSREECARAAGADHLFDYKDPDIEKQLASSGTSFDFIIDSIGRRGDIDRFLPLLEPGGTIAIYGLDDFNTMSINPTRARGTFTVYGGHYDEEEAHDEVVSRMADGSLDARIWLDLNNPFELENITSAIAAVRKRQAVKALVRLGGK